MHFCRLSVKMYCNDRACAVRYRAFDGPMIDIKRHRIYVDGDQPCSNLVSRKPCGDERLTWNNNFAVPVDA